MVFSTSPSRAASLVFGQEFDVALERERHQHGDRNQIPKIQAPFGSCCHYRCLLVEQSWSYWVFCLKMGEAPTSRSNPAMVNQVRTR